MDKLERMKIERRIELLKKLHMEMHENMKKQQTIYEEIESVIYTLEHFLPKSKTSILSYELLDEANDRIAKYKSGDMPLHRVREIKWQYISWANGEQCPIRTEYYPNFPDAFFSFVCEQMNWNQL